jgi:hypothetical protein
LFTPEGKPRIAIISIAHLSDAERMFVVTLLLNEVIAWMRRQSGTSSLRAIVYMDEIFGYFPPTANPPSKGPMLTLLKQARAFGVGCVLATQNPVDLDYKGLGNTGTWFIGRLQTERDRDRLLDGLTSALPGGSADRAQLATLLGSLTQRVFLMRNVHDDAPLLLQSRWALSYLRGPLTPAEIGRLMADRKQAAAIATAPTAATRSNNAAAVTAPRPALPAGAQELFVPVRGEPQGIVYKPQVLALAKLHYVDAKLDLDSWQTQTLLAPLADDGTSVQWDAAVASALSLSALDEQPVADAAFDVLPAGCLRAAFWTAAPKALTTQLYQSAHCNVLSCDTLKAKSTLDEAEGAFRSRLALMVREQRDARVADLHAKYAAKLATAQAAVLRAQQKAEREQSQATQQKLQTAISIGATVLGAFFGRKALSATTLNRAGTALRNAGRIGAESADAARADETVASAQQRLADLSAEVDAAVAALDQSLDVANVPLRSESVAPRKADIAIGKVVLLWTPWRSDSNGFAVSAS